MRAKAEENFLIRGDNPAIVEDTLFLTILALPKAEAAKKVERARRRGQITLEERHFIWQVAELPKAEV